MELPEPVTQALMRYWHEGIVPMFSDPEILNPLLERHVRGLIASGELVPRARLQVGGQVELCPIGLEQASRAVLEAGSDAEMPDELRDALKVLAGVFDPVDVEVEVDITTVEPEPEPELPPVEELDSAEPAPVVDEQDPKCSECGERTDVDQALLSSTRWGGVVLCRPCHVDRAERRAQERAKEQT